MDNTQRRKWDKEYAASGRGAREERERGASGRPRPPAGAIVERKALSVGAIIQRDYKKEARVGTKSIVNLDTGEGLGFKCKESVILQKRDYHHIKQKQQRALGLHARGAQHRGPGQGAPDEKRERERNPDAAAIPSRVAAAERAGGGAQGTGRSAASEEGGEEEEAEAEAGGRRAGGGRAKRWKTTRGARRTTRRWPP